MKILIIISAFLFIAYFLPAHAQTHLPKGFKNGTITLTDSTSFLGYLKDNVSKNASVTFMEDAGAKKKIYTGAELISVEIEGTKYLCIRRDFFRVISNGELGFLQKSGDASGRPIYNGNQAIFSKDTEGQPGDYFIYNSRNKLLTLVSRKNFNEVTATAFAGNAAATDKAKAGNGDISQLKEAIDIYNINTIK